MTLEERIEMAEELISNLKWAKLDEFDKVIYELERVIAKNKKEMHNELIDKFGDNAKWLIEKVEQGYGVYSMAIVIDSNLVDCKILLVSKIYEDECLGLRIANAHLTAITNQIQNSEGSSYDLLSLRDALVIMETNYIEIEDIKIIE